MHPTKAKLVAAARQVLLEGGWATLTTEGVRKAAGVSHGSIWHFFPAGLAEVAAGVFVQLHDGIWGDVLAALEESNPAATRVEAAIGRLLARYEAAPGEVRLLPTLEAVLVSDQAAEVVVQSRRRDIENRVAWAVGHLVQPMPSAVLLAVLFGPAWAIIMSMPPGEDCRSAAAQCISAAIAALARPPVPAGRRSSAAAKPPPAPVDQVDLFAPMAGGTPSSSASPRTRR